MAQEISLDELLRRLVALNRRRLSEIQQRAMGGALEALEAGASANIQSRLTMRSRELLTTLRSTLEVGEDTVTGTTLVGGKVGGLDVAYARLQEEGGTIKPVKGKYLMIPIDSGLTGPGIPKYRSVRQMPYAQWQPLHGQGKVHYVVYDRRNLEVYFLAVTESTVPGKHYLRDAHSEVAATLADRLAAAAADLLEAA